jgi:predicted nucleotidyltransferase
MTAGISEPFGRGAALSDREGRVLARLLGGLRAGVGENLLAVWLYGSRARGEADPAQMDPDLRSDVDLLAIVDPASDARQIGWDAMKLIEAAADAEGDSPVYYSLRVFDADYLRERRRIHSFFLQEVDRDKVVLHGGPLDGLSADGEKA